ncbi:MAG TPA: GNAT family N-acetyltransferase [Streptosporangiaceae bacterium]|nr:GNAT family N-acetyltransferase [Streptosporangiaceae bacterium]
MDAEITAAELETARLRLTAVREADAGEMAVVLGDPRLHEFIGGSPLGVAELRAQYRRWLAGPASPGELWLNWVVRRRATGEAVGTLQATVTRGAGGGLTAGVAWVIGLPWQGSGFAAESAAALVAWLSGVGVAEVTACIGPGHRASERVAERAGLRPTTASVDGERVWRWPGG